MRRGAHLTAIALAVCAACSTTTSAANGKTSVVASFYPLSFVAEKIGGSAVSVTNLTPPGAEPHDLELRPSDVVAIRNARLVLYLHGFQPAVDDAVRAVDGSRQFDALSLITPRRLQDGSIDPHFWLDPTLLVRVATRVEQHLERLVPAQAGVFQHNLTGLDAELAQLDRDLKAGVSKCARHEIFTGHTAFGYLAERYGLRQIGITGLNPEAEPSPHQLANIIETARRLHPTVIYAETLVSSRSVDAVARAVGAKVAVLNPIEGLFPAQESAGDDYLSLMRKNLRTLEEGLDCSAAL